VFFFFCPVCADADGLGDAVLWHVLMED
jgi:hypothetical protein